MSNATDRRQEVYDKIRQTSKKEFILQEMKRLGFWDETTVDFKKVEAFFKEERELSAELKELQKEANIIKDPEAFIAKMHADRKAASKLKQKETKERREQLRKEKAQQWEATKETDLIYLGDGVSHQLNNKETNLERLHTNNLPIIENVEDLAQVMGISVGKLRFLAFSRKNSTISHYKRFFIKKKSGGTRLISAPMPQLKDAQHWILEKVLNKVPLHPKAHGCVISKSIKSNAIDHVGKDVVINQDLQNFFPTITYNRIKGMFKSLGYSEQLSVVFALLCSEPKVNEIDVLGQNYYAQHGDRFLPQGSPCSPAITNIICKKLDFRLDGIAKKYGFEYSRYVDDITFSAKSDTKYNITAVLKYSRLIIKEENFNLHPDKLRIMKKGERQEVTGIVVNEKTNVNKTSLKKFRALLFQIEKDGLENKHWNGNGDLLSQINGYANFIYQVNPEKGKPIKERVSLILHKYNYKENHKNKFVNTKQAREKWTYDSPILNKIIKWFKK